MSNFKKIIGVTAPALGALVAMHTTASAEVEEVVAEPIAEPVALTEGVVVPQPVAPTELPVDVSTDRAVQIGQPEGSQVEGPVDATPEVIDSESFTPDMPTAPAQGGENVEGSRATTEQDTTLPEVEVTPGTKKGHIDVYVEHDTLNDAITKAAAIGVNINRETTETKVGNGEETRRHITEVKEYYTNKEREVIRVMQEYKTALYNHEVDLANTNAAINSANVVTSQLVAQLTSQGRTVNFLTKEYKVDTVEADRANLMVELQKQQTPEVLATAVQAYTYTLPKEIVEKPEAPTVHYKVFDIRMTPEVSTTEANKDGDVIAKGANVKAVKGSTIVVTPTQEPLPEGRFDKFHFVESYVAIPEGLELDESMTVSNEFYKVYYDKDSRLLTMTMTAKGLVDVNLKQATNHGDLSGHMLQEKTISYPKVAFKVLENNKRYTLNFETIINHEFMGKAATLVIETQQADPEKHSTRDGVNIDGKYLLPGDELTYELTWDFDQYRGVKFDNETKSKGLRLFDVYPDKAVDVNTSKIQIYQAGSNHLIAEATVDGFFIDKRNDDNEAIQGLTWKLVDAADYPQLPKVGDKALMIEIKPVDANGMDFFSQYVANGINLSVRMDMKTKVVDQTPGIIGGVYGGLVFENRFFQDDFGNVYESNTVKNGLVKMNPLKDAVESRSDLTSLDIRRNPQATIEHGSHFQYRLRGSHIPKNVVMTHYGFEDYFNMADQYDGEYFVESNTPIYFKEGSALHQRYLKQGGMLANTDVTRYTTQVITRNVSKDINTNVGAITGADEKLTKVDIQFDPDFLSQIDWSKTEFQVDVFLQAKRTVNKQDVMNVFSELVNKVRLGSTEVKTNTRQNLVDKLNDTIEALKDKLTAKDTEHDDRINGNAEAINNLDTKVDNLDGKVDNHKGQADNALDSLDKKTDLIDKKVDAVDKKTDLVNKRVDLVNDRVDQTNKEVEVNKHNIAGLTKDLGVVKDTQKGHGLAIDDLKKEKIGKLTITDTTVKTKDEALAYAKKQGILATDIVKVEKVGDHYEITYKKGHNVIITEKETIKELIKETEKKSDDKTEDKKSDDKQSEDKKSEDKPLDDKKSEDKKSEDKKSEDKKECVENTTSVAPIYQGHSMGYGTLYSNGSTKPVVQKPTKNVKKRIKIEFFRETSEASILEKLKTLKFVKETHDIEIKKVGDVWYVTITPKDNPQPVKPEDKVEIPEAESESVLTTEQLQQIVNGQ